MIQKGAKMEKTYSTVTIKNLKGESLFSASNVTVQDALNGYAATYAHKNTEDLVGEIGGIFLKV